MIGFPAVGPWPVSWTLVARSMIWRNRSLQFEPGTRSTLVLSDLSREEGKTTWISPPRSSISSRNRMSDPQAADANPIPAPSSASFLPIASRTAPSISGENLGSGRSGRSTMWPAKMTTWGTGRHRSIREKSNAKCLARNRARRLVAPTSAGRLAPLAE
ncbi:MAG: hypothetical protein HY720_17200 [Planctomycetes bacterium]|nr:hypothetical protein [Planctomycetota bacterium]